MVRSFFVTCPQAIRTANRKARNRKREKKPEVRALVKAWCIGKVCSCGCGRPANTAHHPRGELYESDLRYLNLNECEPYYHTCHHLHHRGLVRCPSCGGWMRQGNEKCAKCQGCRMAWGSNMRVCPNCGGPLHQVSQGFRFIGALEKGYSPTIPMMKRNSGNSPFDPLGWIRPGVPA